MEITKPGDPSRRITPHGEKFEFHCDNCGCEFNCRESELAQDRDVVDEGKCVYTRIDYTAICPCCYARIGEIRVKPGYYGLSLSLFE